MKLGRTQPVVAEKAIGDSRLMAQVKQLVQLCPANRILIDCFDSFENFLGILLDEPVVKSEGKQIQKLLDLFSFGFDHWLGQKNPEEVFGRIKAIDKNPICRVHV